ncbi:hypothetical protein HMPREF1548_01384 [Clostridium sp. KLE 1755]|nr:hypothetical protein HMPREF1548_01384 [Clostridium sp. KLE 1755]
MYRNLKNSCRKITAAIYTALTEDIAKDFSEKDFGIPNCT